MRYCSEIVPAGVKISLWQLQYPHWRGIWSYHLKSLNNTELEMVMRLENITVFEECFPNHVMLLKLFIQRAGWATVAWNSLSAVTGRMPHPDFRKQSITLGCSTLSRQQMPMFGDICYITFTDKPGSKTGFHVIRGLWLNSTRTH
jgi:hypothetical protein